MQEYNDIYKSIEDAKKILITTHLNPDYDAIASSVALYWIIKSIKSIDVEIAIQDPNPFSTSFIQGMEKVLQQDLSNEEYISQFDLVFILDANRESRIIEKGLEFDANQKIIIIDHHLSDSDIEADIYVKKQVPSTSEIIVEIFRDKVDFSPTIAKALLTGIYDDTNGFSIRAVNKNTFLIVAELIEAGASVADIAAHINRYDETILNAMKTLINNLKFDEDYKYSYSYISNELYEFLELTPNKVDTIMNLFIEILIGREGYNWGFIVRPSGDNRTKVSFRSRDDSVNVRVLAEALGGGGHDAASGATLESDDPYEALAQTRNKIEEILKKR